MATSEGALLDGCPEISVLDAFACGRASPSELHGVERHLATCNACASAVGEVMRAGAATDAPAQRIGRYVLLEQLGRGASATVHAAYDPRLRRRVALKISTPGSTLDGVGRERALREAQALARVEHPNVLTVFDVSSVDHDPMYIAMELIEGDSLRGWCARADRPWRSVLRVLIDAAHGLAALHAAGIVHRDVKPDNILVGDDGRVRVADLGLARADDPHRGDVVEIALDDGALDVTLTRTGALLGTPRYMSPEHFVGGELDARSDQFGFCVAATEALFATLPFPGADMAELRAAVERGPATPQPSKRAPAALWRVLRRGLAPAAADRHPDMFALVDALERVAHRRRRALFGLAGVGVLAAAALAWSQPTTHCRETLEFAEQWSPAHARTLEAAFATTAARHGPMAARAIEADLRQWSERWNAAYLARCTALPAERVAAQDDPQLACLERERVEYVADLDALATVVDETSSDRIVTMVRALPSPRECERVTGDRAIAASEAERDLERRLADVLANDRLARHGEARRGLAELREAIDEVRPALQARIHLAASQVLATHDTAEQTDAAELAVRAAVRSDDAHLLGRALVARADVMYEVGRFDATIAAAELAELTLGELDRGSADVVEARLIHAVALQRLGRIEDAIAVLEPLEPALEPDTVPWALYQQGLAKLLGQHGEDARAHAAFDAALAVLRTQYGPHGDDTVRVGLAVVEFAREHADIATQQRAMPQACVDPTMRASLDRATVSDCLVGQGLLDQQIGELARAEASLREAARLREEALGAGAPATLAVRDLLATLAWQRGDLASAEASFRDLAQAHARAGNREGEASVAGNLAAALALQGRTAEAVVAYERSLTAATSARLRARALSGLAESYVELGRAPEAIATLERGLGECERGGVPAAIEMDIRWALARALETSTPARADDLAEAARQLAVQVADTATRDAIVAWIEARDHDGRSRRGGG